MSANLGNVGKRMRLQCSGCEWLPPEDATMEAVQLHFQVEHDADEVKLNLVVICRCGAVMTYTESAEHGGETIDFFRCGPCGNTGYAVRKPDGAS